MILRSALLLVLFLTLSILGTAQVEVPEFKLYPAPAWVKDYPLQELNREYGDDLQMVHSEIQYNDLTKEYYYRELFYLRTIHGLNRVKSYSVGYEPDFQTVRLNQVNLHRAGEIISLDQQLHVEYKMEGKQVGGEHYDDDGKVLIFLDQAQVGDLIEVAFTLKGQQPDVHGALSYCFSPKLDLLNGWYHARVVSSPILPLEYTLINHGKGPVRSREQDRQSLEWSFFQSQSPEKLFGPRWYENDPSLYVFNEQSWDDYREVSLSNFRLDEPVSASIRQQVNALTQGVEALPEQINRILNFVQSDIQYLNYGLIDPKRPETVLRQGFGDCKSKSLLAIKMLEVIDVPAWPVIVKSSGLDDRLKKTYSGQAFDHCVLEFKLEEDTLMFDSTNDPQKGGLDKKYTNDFRYGLRILEGEKGLTEIKRHHDRGTILEATIGPPDGDNYRHKVRWKMGFEGQKANEMNHLFNKSGIKEVFVKNSQELTNYAWMNADEFDLDLVAEEEEPRSWLMIESKNDLDVFRSHTHMDSLSFWPSPLYDWLKELPEKDKMGGAYFALPDFKRTNQTYKIFTGIGYGFREDSFGISNDWLRYQHRITIEGDTLIARYSAEILKPYLEVGRFDEVDVELRKIRSRMSFEFERVESNRKEREGRRSSRMWEAIGAIAILVSLVGLFVFAIVKWVRMVRKRNHRIQSLQEEVDQLKDEKSRGEEGQAL